MDLVRFFHGPILWLVPILILVISVFWAILKYGQLEDNEKQSLRTVRTVVLILLVVGVAWHVIVTLSVNATPRAVIDRTVVEERKSTLEEDSHNLPPKVDANGKVQNIDVKGDTGR